MLCRKLDIYIPIFSPNVMNLLHAVSLSKINKYIILSHIMTNLFGIRNLKRLACSTFKFQSLDNIRIYL